MAASTLELRLSVPDFVSQFWRKIGGKAWKVARVRERTRKYTNILCNRSNCKYPPTTLETQNQVDEN